MDLSTLNLTRESLYEKVWATPITSISKDYSVRDHEIIQLCEKNNIPRPPSGYWSRLRHGYRLDRPPLPASVIPESKGTKPQAERRKLSERPPEKFIHPKLDFEANDPIEIHSPHPLVSKTYEAYQSIHPDKTDRLRCKEEALNVWVGYRSLDRAMFFMDLLIKELETQGHPVSIEMGRLSETWTTFVKINGEKLPFHVEESSVKKPVPTSEPGPRWRNQGHEYVASGTLSLIVENYLGETRQPTWTDLKTRRLEQRIPEVIDGMIQAAEKLRAIRLVDEERHEKARVEEERVRKIAEAEKFRKDQIAQLDPCALAWEKAERIRNFTLALQSAAIEKFGGIEPGSPIAVFIERAMTHADLIDPVIQTLKAIDQNQHS